ncbi:unnamed protein product, partial [Mesorhabditis spiculigera]
MIGTTGPGIELRPKGPSEEELIFLLEKQDAILETLMADVGACRGEVEKLRSENILMQREASSSKDGQHQTSQQLHEVTTQLEQQRAQNVQLQAEISELRSDSTFLNPVARILQFEERIRELEFTVERQKRALESQKHELAEETRQKEETRKELEKAWADRKELAATLNSKMEHNTKKEARDRLELLEKSGKLEERVARLTAENEVLKQRADLFEAHNGKLAAEINDAKKERLVLLSRNEVLNEENMTLRTKVLKLGNVSNTGETSKEVAALQKLVGDQAHLNSALREECRLLTDKIDAERRHFRSESKALRKEKRDLELRLERLLMIGDIDTNKS